MTAQLDKLAAGLAALLATPGGPAVRVGPVSRLSGGASQETWAFDAVVNGQTEALILRRAPPGAELRASGNAGLAAEAELIRRAAAVGVPVPAVVAVLQPQHQLGDGFVMRRLHGETLGRRVAAAHRPALAWQCGAALARIHALDMAGGPVLRQHPAACRGAASGRLACPPRHGAAGVPAGTALAGRPGPGRCARRPWCMATSATAT